MSTARHGAQQDASALLSVSQTATRLGVSKRTIWSLISSGALQVHRIGSRSVRIRPEDIEVYLDRVRERPAEPHRRSPRSRKPRR
ncbi:MAG: helix-turn-helix domain-containing protein [Planctomycetes bacterium]|nr:helix-turn-helix domain-containing protein [Planctomycetota bacterium]